MSLAPLWDVAVGGIGVVFTARLGLVLAAAVAQWWRRPLPLTAPALPPAVVLIPAFREERVIAASARAALASDYPDLRVVVIDDGSPDRTSEVARAIDDSRLSVLTLPINLGKSGALNAGLDASSEEIVFCMDADTLWLPHTARALAAPIALGLADAVACNLKVGNRNRVLTMWQSLEYLVGLNTTRRAQDLLGCVTTVPGAAAAFRREALTQVGCWSSDTTTEDTDLSLSLLRAGRIIRYQPAAIAYTEAPESWTALTHQRTRWLFGFWQNIIKHRRAFLSFSALGFFGMPNLALVNFLAFPMALLVLPWTLRAVEITSPQTLAAAVWAWMGIDLLLAVGALFADREPLRHLLYAPLQLVVWPFYLLFVFFRVGTVRILAGDVPWKKLERTGTNLPQS